TPAANPSRTARRCKPKEKEAAVHAPASIAVVSASAVNRPVKLTSVERNATVEDQSTKRQLPECNEVEVRRPCGRIDAGASMQERADQTVGIVRSEDRQGENTGECINGVVDSSFGNRTGSENAGAEALGNGVCCGG